MTSESYATNTSRSASLTSHKILTIVWHLLSTGAFYDDPGGAAVHKRSDEQILLKAVRQLETLGYQVAITPQEVA
jgi:transposase